MQITIQSIEHINFQPAFVGIIANLVGTIPYFHVSWDVLIPKDKLRLFIWAYPHRINHLNKIEASYRFYPCCGEARQEYCTSTFEHPQRPPERVPDDTVVWVFLPKQDEYDDRDNNDNLWYIIGEAIEYSPSIDPYSDDKFPLQNYSYPDMPPFIYGNSWFFLQVWDLRIPLKSKVIVWEKYKITCTIFTKYGQFPQYDGCLSIDWMITETNLRHEELRVDGIESEAFYKKFSTYFARVANIK